MNVLVYGAGAVGGYLGACLQRAGHEVTLLARTPVAAAIAADGLTVLGAQDGAGWQARPRVATDLATALDGSVFDLIILGMKSYAVDEAIEALAAALPAPPPLLAIQNGIGIEERIAARFGPERVVAGAVTIPLSRPAPAAIRVERADRGLTLAPVEAGAPLAPWIDLFAAADIATTAVEDHQALKWSKALLNMVGNATAAILDWPPGLVYRTRTTFHLEMAMLREMLAVMARRRTPVLDLSGSPARQLARAVRWLPGWLLQPILARLVAQGRGDKLPSFLLDLNAGKPHNEVAYHNGAVARAGEALGVAAPVNAGLATILLDLVAGRQERAAFRGRPEALAAALASSRRQTVPEA